MVDVDDARHQILLGEFDEVEDAAAQECVRQLLLRVRGDHHHGTLAGDHLVARLGDDEPHPVQLVQEVVGELQIGLVDLVDEEHDPVARGERLPERPVLDVPPDVLDVAVAESRVVQALDGVVDVQPVLRPRGGLHGPVDQAEAQGRRDGLGELRRPLQRQGAVDRRLERRGGEVLVRATEPAKFHRHILTAFPPAWLPSCRGDAVQIAPCPRKRAPRGCRPRSPSSSETRRASGSASTGCGTSSPCSSSIGC